MSKNSMQDVVPPEGAPRRRTIRDIPIEHAHRGRQQNQKATPVEAVTRSSAMPAEVSQVVQVPKEEYEPKGYEQDVPRGRTDRKEKGKKRGGLFMIAGVVIVIALVLGGSALFASATILVTPRKETVTINQSFTGGKAEEGKVPYEIMSLSSVATSTVPATGTTFVEAKASGRIMVYNTYSAAAQPLIANTRFETSDGHIYRIKDPITVPGTTTAGGKTVPGSIEVTVYADAAGEAYNIDLADFTIPGFKGDPRYEKFYARSTTKMSGGFKGTRAVANEADVTRVRAELQTTLKDQLLAQAASQKPEGFVLYDDALFFAFEPLSDAENAGAVEVREQGTLRGIIFNTESLASKIAEVSLPGYDGTSIDIVAPDALSFKLTNKDQISPENVTDVTFSLSGQGELVWRYDQEKLRSELMGISKKDAPQVFAGYPGIEQARVIVRPFWKSTIPNNQDKVAIKLD